MPFKISSVFIFYMYICNNFLSRHLLDDEGTGGGLLDDLDWCGADTKLLREAKLESEA